MTRMLPARRAFTVLELLLALVLTAVAVTLAASAVRAATDVRDRVTAAQGRVDDALRWRAMLTDMLRHAPPADLVDEPLLRIAPTAAGTPSLSFLSRGVRMPFGTGPAWRVTVHTDSAGLHLEAVPLGRVADGTQLHAVLRGISGMEIAVLEPSGPLDAPRWRTDWPVARSRPSMIALTFIGASAPARMLVPLDPLAVTSGGAP